MLRSRYRSEVAQILGPNAKLYCTEYSGGLFQNTYDHSYVAAFLFHNAPLIDWIPLSSFWAVSDVFEEGGIRSREFTNQYGMISINGIPKPSFRAFELLASAGNWTVPLALDDAAGLGTVSAFATSDEQDWLNRSATQVFLSNFAPKGGGDALALPCQAQNVTVRVSARGMSSSWIPSGVRCYRIDGQHANPAETWEAMGSPQYMNRTQLDVLKAASASLDGSIVPVRVVNDDVIEITVHLPADGVVVLKDWA
jgi:xylan 1,4-beta-xylosidase